MGNAESGCCESAHAKEVSVKECSQLVAAAKVVEVPIAPPKKESVVIEQTVVIEQIPEKPVEQKPPEPLPVVVEKEPEPLPVEPTPAPAVIEVVFKPPAKRACFWRKPTGIIFTRDSLTVASVTGDAEDFGIKVGMAVKAIAGSSNSLSMAEYETGLASLQSVKGLRVTFVSSTGVTKPVTFTHQPIGVNFGTTAPLQLTEVTGRAHKMGLEVGMKLSAVDGHDLTDSSYIQTMAALSKGVKSLPLAGAPVEVIFESANGRKTIIFAERPLGVTFFDSKIESRIVVNGVTDQAAELGIQRGWAIKTVQGTDVAGLSYSAAFDSLKRAVATLPERPPTLLMEFEVAEAKRVVFTKRPLGFRTTAQAPDAQEPLTLSVCQGLAAQEGLEAGWIISVVDGTEVANMSYESALAVLNLAEARLPA